jgi:hypothetical protein
MRSSPAILVLGAALAAPFARPAAASDPPAPPPGWEQPPPLPGKRPAAGKPPAPACCAYDQTCCERQRAIDAEGAPRVARVVEVRPADLPEISIHEAQKEHPGIPGAPTVRVIDGKGRPPPWRDGPRSEVRVMPPGRLGEITWRDTWASPFFAEPQYRGMGYGSVLVTEGGYSKQKVVLEGPVSFIAIDEKGGRVTYDFVEGTLQPTLEHVATRWEHVEAATVFDGYVHGWRGKLNDDPAVTFLLPMVTLGFESKDAKSHGGLIPSRFSSSVAFTRYTLPYGPGRSALVTFTVTEWEAHRWFPRPAGSEKLPEARSFAIAASQTSVEAEPRVRLLIFDD